jgi:predicted metal-dependent hydrolase
MNQRPLALTHQGHRIEYTLAHRSRVTRRVHLELDEAGGLRVVKPRRMSRRAVQRLLQEHSGWVARFVRKAQEQRRDVPDKAYSDGETVLFLGQPLLLCRADPGPGRPRVQRANGQLMMALGDGSVEQARRWLRDWYRKQAAVDFAARLEAHCARAPWTKGRLPPLRLRRMRRTWGSCSPHGVITLNPHLLKAPPDCVDYVVAHELCHLQEHNHGAGFYRLLEILDPRWHERRAKLRANAHIYLNE